MQGVARAGSSNFQSNLQGRLDKSDEAQRSALEKQQSGGLAKMKQEMELAQMDPASPISRSTQRAHMATLKSMGYTPEDAASISANAMPDVLAKRISLEDIRENARGHDIQAEQNAIALGLKQQGVASQKESDARKLLLGRGTGTRIFDALTRNPAIPALEKEANLGTGMDVKYITNKATGETRMSTDGGLTWGALP
jgi:hypothetical protein